MKLTDLLLERITTDELYQWRSDFDTLPDTMVQIYPASQTVKVHFSMHGVPGVATFVLRDRDQKSFMKKIYAAALSNTGGKKPSGYAGAVAEVDGKRLRPHARFILTNPRHFDLESIKHRDIQYPNP